MTDGSDSGTTTQADDDGPNSGTIKLTTWCITCGESMCVTLGCFIPAFKVSPDYRPNERIFCRCGDALIKISSDSSMLVTVIKTSRHSDV